MLKKHNQLKVLDSNLYENNLDKLIDAKKLVLNNIILHQEF